MQQKPPGNSGHNSTSSAAPLPSDPRLVDLAEKILIFPLTTPPKAKVDWDAAKKNWQNIDVSNVYNELKHFEGYEEKPHHREAFDEDHPQILLGRSKESLLYLLSGLMHLKEGKPLTHAEVAAINKAESIFEMMAKDLDAAQEENKDLIAGKSPFEKTLLQPHSEQFYAEFLKDIPPDIKARLPDRVFNYQPGDKNGVDNIKSDVSRILFDDANAAANFRGVITDWIKEIKVIFQQQRTTGMGGIT